MLSAGFFFIRASFAFFRSIVSIHRVHFYPLFSYHLFFYNTNIHAPDGIRTRNPSRRAATELRHRRRGHRDRQIRTRDPKNREAAGYALDRRATGIGPF